MGKQKNNISVVFIGHVDSGKSTVSGHLVFKCGGIDKRTMEKFEKESADMGKASFKYAWVLDKTKTERERGITVETAITCIKTPRNDITIVDSPGHRDFLKNMIGGTSTSDCAILVVPGAQGEAETALGENGAAKEHATLAYILGVKRIAVCINKMDTVAYSESRFNELKAACQTLVKAAGFQVDAVAFMPISGFVGDNMTEPSTNLPWFKGWSYDWKMPDRADKTTIKGVTLMDYLDALDPPVRATDKPLRMPCGDVYKISGVGAVVTGHVETGIMKVGMMAFISPVNITAEVKSIEMHHQQLTEAVTGDNIGFNSKSISHKDVKRGFVVGDSKNDPPRECLNFTAQVISIRPLGKEQSGIHQNYTPIIDVHTAHIPCRFVEICHKVDKRTGKVITPEEDDVYAKVVRNAEAAIVIIAPQLPMVVEAFSEYAPLGRFAVRDSKYTIAIGIIKKVEKKEIESKAKAGASKAGVKAGGAKGGAKAAGGKK